MALTKVNLANTVEGVLPVANGGTGTSTGVAPGGSTTQVQYNNAGAFGGDSGFVYTGGNVGIGTTSPGAILDVKGTNPQIIARGSTGVEPRIRLYSDTTVRGHISSSATYGLDINSETSMRLFTNGGAGSTTPVVIDTSGNFVVGGTAALATAANRGNITVNGVSESILALGVSAATKGYLYQGSANMNLVNAGTGVLTLENNGSERFRVGSSGQLGIAGANYGTSGQVLISGGASAAPSWGAVTMPAGSVIQVVNVDNSTLYSFTGSVNVFSASITPSSASNKVLVICSIAFGYSGDAYPYVYMLRNGTSISTGTSASGNQRNVFLAGYGTSTSGTPYRMSIFAKSYLDSPGTTSAVTYQIQAQCEFGTGYINRQSDQSNNVYINYPTSNITLMEIKG